MDNKTSLLSFHPVLQHWFEEHYLVPTDIQNQVWPIISKNQHVLMTAPTGSGKTLAAFLWAINQLVSGEWETGQVRVLYISPLKSLNNDIQKNLIDPLEQIQRCFEKAGQNVNIRVLTRSGDTSASERQRIIRKPPEILIITPESLNLILSSKKARWIFSGLATVIIDEIHALAGTKRGTHLITAVDRLIRLSGEFQRIGISATVRPLSVVADFMAGFQQRYDGQDWHYKKRHVHIITSRIHKKVDVTVCFPDNATDLEFHQSKWPVLTQSFVNIIHKNRSTLFFCNSRRLTEKITRLINESCGQQVAYSHHGSLSKEMRLLVENKLKKGELKAIVATKSLELGIDIGSLDEIILVQTPFEISSAIQRLGRSGHSINDISVAKIYPTHGRDFLNAAIMTRAMIDLDIEPIQIPKGALDVLAQVIISITGTETWDIDELFAFIKTSYPFHELLRQSFDLVLDMLAGRYAESRIRELRPRISIDKIDNTVHAKDTALKVLYISGGTIPDRGYFDLRLKDSHAKIGELDEEFVWERTLGDVFVFGTQVWKIHSIDFQNVFVTQESGSGGMAPFWRSEAIGRDFYFSEKISLFLEKWHDTIDTKDDNQIFKQTLMTLYGMDKSAAETLITFLVRQISITKADLPHRHHILIEHFSDPLNQTDSKQVILHTLWGGKVNHPFAISLSQAWEERYGYPLHVFFDDDCIILNLPHEFSGNDILNLVSTENIKNLLRKKLEKTGLFGSRFRENAAIALLLPKKSFNKRMPLWLNRLRSKKLLDSVLEFEDFPILAETWRTCFHDYFDLNSLFLLLDEISQGIIAVTETITRVPSPFTSNVLWQQSNQLMYENDTPSNANMSRLRQDIFNDVVYRSDLRPAIPAAVIEEFTQKVQRTFPGYAPLTIEDALDFLKDRRVIPLNEWKALLNAIYRDNGTIINEQSPEFKRKVNRILLPNAEIEVVIAVENQSFIDKSLQTIDAFTHFLESWISYYGPLKPVFIKQIFGIEISTIQKSIDQLSSEHQLIYDNITFGQSDIEICDARNLEILLRILRKQNRPEFKAKNINDLPLFFACWQGLTQKETSGDCLQEILEQLIGYPCKAELWESDILPARLNPYYTDWMDSLLHNSEFVWIGNNKKTLFFCYESDLELFLSNHTIDLAHIFPDPSARYRLTELCEHSQLNSQQMTQKLWELFFQGAVSNDHFPSVRKGIQTNYKASEIKQQSSKKRRFHRSGFNRWKSTRSFSGNWFIPQVPPLSDDLLAQEVLLKDRIYQLFDRYGILFREMVTSELPCMQWSTIFNQLRLMELSGEIFSGYFFQDIQGIQFISHKAFRLLNVALPHDVIYWINAADPISMCGIGPEKLKKQLPSRISTTHLVYHGTTLVLISKSKGKHLEFFCSQNAPYLQNYMSFFKILLSRQFNPLPRIVIETINQKPAHESEYLHCLISYGFEKDYNQLILTNNQLYNVF